jgi:hypothetical protein
VLGSVAGSKNWAGYILIPVNRATWRAHHLAWLYVYGRLPAQELDHVNGVPSDNRIANLREVTRAQNVQNQRAAQKRSKSGFLGVSHCPLTKRWRARICTNGVQRMIGRFNTPEEAHAAYVEAKRQQHVTCTI